MPGSVTRNTESRRDGRTFLSSRRDLNRFDDASPPLKRRAIFGCPYGTLMLCAFSSILSRPRSRLGQICQIYACRDYGCPKIANFTSHRIGRAPESSILPLIETNGFQNPRFYPSSNRTSLRILIITLPRWTVRPRPARPCRLSCLGWFNCSVEPPARRLRPEAERYNAKAASGLPRRSQDEDGQRGALFVCS